MSDWVRNKPKIEYTIKKGMYEPHEMTEALQRIKNFLVERDVALCPATQQDVENFEKKHQIVLPLAYRRFILEVTDGIDKGKPFSLPKLIGKECKGYLNTPFPLRNFWHAEGDSELQENDADLFDRALHEVNNFGQICLDFDQELWSLITAGDCYGEVWNVGNGNIWFFSSMLFPRCDFLNWFEWCLENKVDINDGNDAAEKSELHYPDNFWEKFREFDRS
jgi:hypothetical protein